MTPWTLTKNGRGVSFEPPFPSIGALLGHWAQKQPKKPALIFEDVDRKETISISYQELQILVQKTAHLLGQKLGKHKAFSFAFHNSPQLVILNLAAWATPYVSVPLDTKRDTPERKIYKLKLTGARILFTRNGRDVRRENAKIKKALPNLEIIALENFATFCKLLPKEAANLDGKLEGDSLILFTSGTTANPKGTRLSVQNLLANADSIANWMQFEKDDRFHVLLPLHHINSTTFLTTTLLVGGTVVLSSRYSKSQFWQVSAKHKCTGASVVPTIAYDLLTEEKSFKKHKGGLGQLTRIQIGSAPVQPMIAEQFIKKYKIKLVQGYGQTETALRSTGVPMDLTPKEYRQAVKLNTVGTEIKWANVSVLTPEGREAKEGKLGEICVRGPCIMSGYLKNPQANKEAFAYGWFHSGDTGYWRQLWGRRFFFLVGRTKEVIHKGGVLVSPLAVENALLAKYPKLEAVYVVGFPHPRLGEEIGAVFVSKDEKIGKRILEDVKVHRIKNLSHYEYPQAILRVKEESLPKTSTGKVQRLKIKEQFGKKLLQNYRTITKAGKVVFRLIGPEEKEVLGKAREINNTRWGRALQSTIQEFTLRAQNGILIGAFDSQDKLLGTVSALQVAKTDIEKAGKYGFWTSTWLSLTGKGTLSTHNHKGDALVCAAISVVGSNTKNPRPGRRKITLTPDRLKGYLSSDLDYVVRFHRKRKGGLKQGAKIVKILPQARREDKDALGYNLLMQYPTLGKEPIVTPNASVGTQLIEAALVYAWQKKLKTVYAYTRPAQLSQYFIP